MPTSMMVVVGGKNTAILEILGIETPVNLTLVTYND